MNSLCSVCNPNALTDYICDDYGRTTSSGQGSRGLPVDDLLPQFGGLNLSSSDYYPPRGSTSRSDYTTSASRPGLLSRLRDRLGKSSSSRRRSSPRYGREVSQFFDQLDSAMRGDDVRSSRRNGPRSGFDLVRAREQQWDNQGRYDFEGVDDYDYNGGISRYDDDQYNDNDRHTRSSDLFGSRSRNTGTSLSSRRYGNSSYVSGLGDYYSGSYNTGRGGGSTYASGRGIGDSGGLGRSRGRYASQSGGCSGCDDCCRRY